jgi:hypothetical protein
MAYRINLTNGTDLISVADGTINAIGSASSLTLIGKNFAGYGEYLNENFIRLLENFADANTNPPPSPLEGQLWWDSTTGSQTLKVRKGNEWVAASGITNSSTAPTSPNIGDFWWDTNTGQLKIWTDPDGGGPLGLQWVVIGPAYTVNQGPTGAFTGSAFEGSTEHTIVEFKVGGKTVAILSKDQAFSPNNPTIPGFATIYPGFNLTTVLSPEGVPAYLYNGVATSIVNQANSATIPAATAATPNTIVLRDGSGNISGTSSSARYADLAERFEADRAYLPGTVVALGGVAEITAAMEDLSDEVFGVISTHAAYLMNSEAGSNETHPAVAMQGRVPVRVIGKIKKGDRLVSAGGGLARAAKRTEITSFNVIGRSLEDKATTEEGTVEAIVKMNS